MGEVMKDAAFSLAEAKFACGDFNQPVLQNVNKAQLKVRFYFTILYDDCMKIR